MIHFLDHSKIKQFLFHLMSIFLATRFVTPALLAESAYGECHWRRYLLRAVDNHCHWRFARDPLSIVRQADKVQPSTGYPLSVSLFPFASFFQLLFSRANRNRRGRGRSAAASRSDRNPVSLGQMPDSTCNQCCRSMFIASERLRN